MDSLGLFGVKPMMPSPPMVGPEPNAEPAVGVVVEPGAAVELPLASVEGVVAAGVDGSVEGVEVVPDGLEGLKRPELPLLGEEPEFGNALAERLWPPRPGAMPG